MKLCSGSGRKVKRLNHAPGFSCRGKFQALHVLKRPLENSRFCLRKLRRGGENRPAVTSRAKQDFLKNLKNTDKRGLLSLRLCFSA